MFDCIDFGNITLSELAGAIGQFLQDHGVDATLVGGACVSIYTHNKYQSYDLDFIAYESQRKVASLLKRLGFEYDTHKYFKHPDCIFFVEFLAPPIAIGNEPVNRLNSLKVNTGVIKLLTPTDCVKDRLAAYFHWDDKQSLAQAVWVAREQVIDLRDVKKWSKNEGHIEKFKLFDELLKAASEMDV